ncbi:COP9 signalosome (CSN) subunit [Blyttiomyces sp. JEL0837]|nr:COP9 signalosome (CSN) subunit [Blyttiomyces sp. JEL0837]
MTTGAIKTYATLVAKCASDEDGDRLAALLSISGSKPQAFIDAVSIQHPNSWETITRKLDSPWGEICQSHLKVLKYTDPDSNSYNPEEAFKEQNLAAQFLHQSSTTLQSWILPVIYTINSDLFNLSIKADTHLTAKSQKPKCLEETARTLNKAFSVCATDRFSSKEYSRKWGAYYICNLLMRTYFKLGQINLCTNLLRSMQNADLPDIELYPISHVITYKYYLGVLAFYNEQYAKAEQERTFDLLRSPNSDAPECIRNRRRILNYLIPSRLILGHVPHPNLFTRYPSLRETYGSIITAIGLGNLGLFDTLIAEKQRELIRKGTYLTIERWLIKDKSNRIEFSSIQVALKHVGSESDMDEIECMLANLIDKGLMKGYMSHEKSTLVLSKEQPFPPVSAAVL